MAEAPRRLIPLLVAVAAILMAGPSGPAPAQTLSGGPPAGKPLDAPASDDAPLTVGLLASARTGEFYSRAVIRGGQPSYHLEVVTGLPPGLHMLANGRITGTPRTAGTYHPHVEAHDSANAPVGGDWTIVVRKPEPEKKTPEKPGVPVVMKPSVDGGGPGQVTVYRLTLQDLAALDAQEKAAQDQKVAALQVKADAQASARQQTQAQLALADPVPGAKPAAQGTPAGATGGASAAAVHPVAAANGPYPLATTLASMTNREYPNLALFQTSLQYYLAKSRADDTPAQAAIEEQTAAKAQPSIEARAAKSEMLAKSPALHWASKGGCDCVHPTPSHGDRMIYGFMPFWRSTPATKDAPQIDFSLYDRIGLLGVQITANGHWISPQSPGRDWWNDTSAFASAAEGHGTHLDLVLQGADWSMLRGKSQEERRMLAETAARNAVERSNGLLTDNGKFVRWFLWGLWGSPTHVFDGITVMFTPPQVAEDKQPFATFYYDFMIALIADMRATGRPYALNIVMNDQPFCKAEIGGKPCDAGAFDLKNLMEFRHRAEADLPLPNPPRANAPPANPSPADTAPAAKTPAKAHLAGKSPKIQMKLLVMIAEFAGDNKKDLRRSIDLLENISGETDYEGEGRVALLHSIVPVLVMPGGEPPSAVTPLPPLYEPGRLPKDLAYLNENFGGAGFWPVSMAGVGSGEEIDKAIRAEFFPAKASVWTNPICSTLLRLAWQVSVLLALIGATLYFGLGGPDKMRRLYATGTVISVAVMAILGGFLLSVDPALAAVKAGNSVLFALGFGAVVILVAINLVPRIREP